MHDRERVIEHLQIVRTWASVGIEPIYNGIEPRCCENVEKWMDDALALLREQEPVKPHISTAKTTIFFEGDCEISLAQCGKCGKPLEQGTNDSEGWKFCPWCGRKVKWDA